MIINPPKLVLENEFFEKRFINKLLTDQRTLRIGGIVSFIAPAKIEAIDGKTYTSKQSINFCIEIPEISNYAGVCFQRLFVTNVANLLAVKYLKEPIEIQNNDVIIKKEHTNGGITQVDGVASLNLIRNINGAILIYMGLYNIAGEKSHPRSYSLNFELEKCSKFMDDVNANFYHLANGVFLQTAKM